MKTTIRSANRLAWLLAGCVAGWSAVPSASAQEAESPVLVASLSSATLPPEVIMESTRPRPKQSIPVLYRKRTDADAWDKFEAEYRVETRNPSAVKRQIETAKYGLDVTTFAVDRFVKSIRDHADFEFARGHFQRTTSRSAMLANPRVKLDLSLTQPKPYIGVRLVIPIGN